MVVKTDLDAFSEYRIYPGHGLRFVKRDGSTVIVGTSKTLSMIKQRKKPAKLTWTQSWRRLNKKGLDMGVQKKKRVKAIRIVRAVVGMSLEELAKKKQVKKPTDKSVKTVKDRKAKRGGDGPRGGASIPKHQVAMKR